MAEDQEEKIEQKKEKKKKTKSSSEKMLTPFSPQFFRPRIYGISLVVLALAIAGSLLVSRYAWLDEVRDLQAWEDKLNLVADSRAQAVSDWVDTHFRGLKKLAENPSLQLYFTELTNQSSATGGGDPAQKVYLRNLLIFTSDRMGFSPQSVPMSVQIPTQIAYTAPSGIAVLDAQGKLVVSTPYLTSLNQLVAEQLEKIPANATAFIDMFKNEDGKPQVGFVVPVFGIQADPANATPIGRIVGIRSVDDSLFKLLHHPGTIEKTMEAMLIRRQENRVDYLSPLEGGAPMEKSINIPPAEAFAIANPGGFSELRDYEGRKVLITGRAIPNTPWTLTLKVDSAEALKDSREYRNGMIMMLVLALIVVVVTVIAVWHNASSRRALFASRYFRDLAERATAQERLLALVADNQPEAVYIIDQTHCYRFANRQKELSVGMGHDSLEGKLVEDVVGSARAQDILKDAEESFTHGSYTRIRRTNRDGEEKIIRTAYIPLAHIPVPGLPDPTPGVLVVEQDISEVVHEREKRLRVQNELIETLIMLVDRRDPHAANHSMLVATIAHEVALSMGLDQPTIDVTRIAGSLMNIGKIVIPPEVLMKRDSLNESELRTIRDSMRASADLLRHITFEGPIVETLEESYEFWDGSGAQGLKEEGILVSARIISVVNAFVGMISPRSYRAAMPIPQALDILATRVDKQFDRRVVAALTHYIENCGGEEMVEEMQREYQHNLQKRDVA